MDERQRLLRAIFGGTGDDVAALPKREINTVPLFPLRQIWPDVVERIKRLLSADGELELAATVEGLEVFDRCRCGVDYCVTVYTQPRPNGGSRPNHRNIVYWNSNTLDLKTRRRMGDTSTSPTTELTTIIDVVDEAIAVIEVLDDHDSRHRLVAALPDRRPSSGKMRQPSTESCA